MLDMNTDFDLGAVLKCDEESEHSDEKMENDEDQN